VRESFFFCGEGNSKFGIQEKTGRQMLAFDYKVRDIEGKKDQFDFQNDFYRNVDIEEIYVDLRI